MADMDFVLKALGVVGGAVFSGYQIVTAIPPSRSRLKTDLEILKLLDTTDPAYSLVKAQTEASLRRIYTEQRESHRWHVHLYSPELLVTGLIMAIGFTIWTFYLDRHGFSWWSVLTGILALGAFGNIFQAFDPASAKRTSPDASPEPAPSASAPQEGTAVP